MGIKKKPSVYEASDGTEFETQAEAERYQALTDAERQYRNASAAYGQMLAETQKTRDGVAFQFGLFQDYWYPIHWGGKPCVIRIGFIGRETYLEGDKLYLIPYQGDQGRNVKRVEVSEVFASETAAKAQLVEELEKYVASLQQEIAVLRGTIPNATDSVP